MARGRGGSRGGASARGGKGGRGGKAARGGGDAASSGNLDDFGTGGGADVAFESASTRARSARQQDVHHTDRRAMRDEDMYDDTDAFMEQRHRVALVGGRGRRGAADEDEDSDAEMALPQRKGKRGADKSNIFELEGLEDEEDDEEEGDGEDNVPGYFDVERAEAAAARERELKAEAAISTGWGKNKSLYYSADTHDYELESDEEVALEEEKEGARLQAEQAKTLAEQAGELDDMLAMVAEAEVEGQDAAAAAKGKPKKKSKLTADSSDAELLKAMDADMDGIDMALDLDLDISALTQAASAGTDEGKGKKGKKGSASAPMLVERITKDLSSVSESEKLEMLLTSSPELLSLLDDFKENMSELSEIMPVWEEIKDDQENTDKAFYCFVSMKVSSLLLYCSHVSFYLSMKAEGRANLQQHPIMRTLLNLKEKIQQLAQLEEYFARKQEEEMEEEEEDEDADLDVEDEEEELEEGEDAEMEEGEDDEDADLDAEEDGLENGLEDDEDDDFDGDDGPVDPSNLAQVDLLSRQSAQLEALLAGVQQKKSLSAKQQRKALKTQQASAAAKGLSDFGEVDHKAEMARNVTVGKASGKLAALQAKVAADQVAQDKLKQGTKRKHQDDFDVGDEAGDEAGGWGSQKKGASKAPLAAGADLYAAAKAAKAAAKAERQAVYAPKVLPPNWVEMSEDERRAASKQIKANRGLVRARRKDIKNPKTRQRLRYEKKLVARNGAVQLFKGSQDAGYGGQSTGIKATLTKSISLKQ